MRTLGQVWLSTFVGTNLTLGVVSQLVVVALLGLGADSDAMFASQTGYLVIYSILGAALGTVLTPMMAREFVARNRVSAFLYLKLLLPFFALISATLWSNSEHLTLLLFGGLTAEAIELTSRMAHTYSLVLLVSLLNVVLSSARRASGRHRGVEASEAVAGAAYLIGVVVLVPEAGVAAVPALALARAFISAALLLDRGDLRAGDAPEISYAAPIAAGLRSTLAGFSLAKTGPLVDRHLCSRAGEGELALVSVLSTVISTFAALIERSVLAPLLVRAAGDLELAGLRRFAASYSRTFAALAALSLVATIAGVTLSRSLFEAAIQAGWHSAAGLERAVELASVMSLCFLGVPGQTAASVLYAMDRHGTVSRIAAANFIVATSMKFLLFPLVGALAVAIGAAAYQMLNSVVLHMALHRELKDRHE